MRLTRRNTIIGMGTLAAGAGVIGGSGAFDQVQAERSFSVGVTDDSNALLQLEQNSNSAISSTTDAGAPNNQSVLAINLQNDSAGGLNDNAVTIFEDAFYVTNNGTQDVDLSVSVLNGDTVVSDPGIAFTVGETPQGNTGGASTNDSLTDSSVPLDSGDRIGVSIKIDTGGGDLDGTYEPNTVTDVLFDASTGDVTTPTA